MNIDLIEIQKRVLKNKETHGFNTTDIKFEILLMYGELNELFKGYMRDNVENMSEELADIVIFALGISEMLGVDLSQKILEKLDINERRIYHEDGRKTLKD